MIIIELLVKWIAWAWARILKPLIRILFWLITARDCEHCKHYKQASMGSSCICIPCCFKNGQIECDRTCCYHTIVRKDFERKKR